MRVEPEAGSCANMEPSGHVRTQRQVGAISSVSCREPLAPLGISSPDQLDARVVAENGGFHHPLHVGDGEGAQAVGCDADGMVRGQRRRRTMQRGRSSSGRHGPANDQPVFLARLRQGASLRFRRSRLSRTGGLKTIRFGARQMSEQIGSQQGHSFQPEVVASHMHFDDGPDPDPRLLIIDTFDRWTATHAILER